MQEQAVKQLLIDTGAILEGHFLLTSGLHGTLYIEKFQVLQWPQHTTMLCEALADRFKDERIEVVVGPVTGGIILAHEVGKKLGTRAIFTEREQGKMTLRRGFSIKPGERVLVVEDIVTTGGSVHEVIDVVKELGGELVAVGLLVDRSQGKASFGVRTEALLHLDLPVYKPEECPLCAQRMALTKRGRTGK
jgi:orotate phosphoribosyltransferase